MKRFPIFRPGRHTAASGVALDFSEDQLRAAVAAYDPALHEAPIVVGHPRDNHPAFGWVGALSYDETTGEIVADPTQVDADFAELVQAGRYKKRSASWYLPDAPNNPKPGTLYLRHVGFLGAQPPAVKGLKDVSFSDAEEGVVEFGESRWAFNAIASAFRNLREWLIADKGTETADKALPNYLIGDVERAANEPPADPGPAFNEEDPMTIAELQAQVAALTAERDQLKTQAGQAADFAERETALAAREAAVGKAEAAAARAAVEARVDAVVQAGRLLPAQRRAAVDFACGLAAAEASIDFGEGDKAEKITQREAYLRQLEAAAKVVDYSEHAGGTGTPPAGAADPQKVADLARVKIAEAEKAGGHMSFTEAVHLATVELSA
jgi:hypothetical protein